MNGHLCYLCCLDLTVSNLCLPLKTHTQIHTLIMGVNMYPFGDDLKCIQWMKSYSIKKKLSLHKCVCFLRCPPKFLNREICGEEGLNFNKVLCGWSLNALPDPAWAFHLLPHCEPKNHFWGQQLWNIFFLMFSLLNSLIWWTKQLHILARFPNCKWPVRISS